MIRLSEMTSLRCLGMHIPSTAWFRMLETTVDGLSDSDALIRLKRHGANRLPAPAGVSAFDDPGRPTAQRRGAASRGSGRNLARPRRSRRSRGNRRCPRHQCRTGVRHRMAGAARDGGAPAVWRHLGRPSCAAGVSSRVDAATLVPGDVIQLDAGNRVPADARVIHGRRSRHHGGGTHRGIVAR